MKTFFLVMIVVIAYFIGFPMFMGWYFAKDHAPQEKPVKMMCELNKPCTL